MTSFFSDISTSESFMQSLACASLTPGLRNILVFDASYAALKVTASILSQMLVVITKKEIQLKHLGGTEHDEELWGRLEISSNEDGQSVMWHQGLLTDIDDGTHLRLILLSDLARLNVTAARSCLTLVGADVAHLERDKQHTVWQPHCYWLANCASNQIGVISPHLLDRFTLRLRFLPQIIGPIRDPHWLEQLLKGNTADEVVDYVLPSDWKERLQRATMQHQPTMSEEAISHVLKQTEPSELHSFRREIMLARLARAIARLEDAASVHPVHVDEAARLIGLSLAPIKQFVPLSDQEDSPIGEMEDILEEDNEISLSSDSLFNKHTRSSQSYINEPNRKEESDEVRLPADFLPGPYPEDHAPIEREIASLQLPSYSSSEAKLKRGIVIGTERATTLHDIAVVSTILAALPYQHIRRKRSNQPFESDSQFLFSRRDLRCYRRVPATESMLVLLIDYTSVRQCPHWRQVLIPYLRNAYVERASICIVQVGADTAFNELQAGRIHARNILVPDVGEALEARHGKATPLAHGFDIMFGALQHALYHGRSAIRQASVIVITDGRGNIPLEASRQGYISAATSVNRQGIDDALAIAQQICDMKGIQHLLLLNPQPKQHPELPYMLARTLGAGILNIPLAREGRGVQP